MLTGVRGVGKTTTARIIARALNCVGADGKGGPTVDPCGVCDNCKAITEDRHVDVIEMDAASRTGIDDVRELIEGVRYRPVSARYKVYIIDEVHMLSEKAFNALLKTLEEPPPHVKFLFATTEIRKVPVTVLSRCQRFDLKRVPQDVLVEHFGKIAATEKVEISPEALALHRPRRRRLGARRAVDARPGDRPWRRRGRCRAGARHAGPGRPQPRARPVREDDARRCAGGGGVAGRDARFRRRSGGHPAGPARTHALGDAAESGARGGGGFGRQRARAGPGDGGQAFHGLAHAGLDAADEGPAGDAERALAAARRRNGADPPLLRGRPALARRCDQVAADRRARPMARALRRRAAAVAAAARQRAWRHSPSAPSAQPAEALPAPRSFTEVVALFETKREAAPGQLSDAPRARGALRARPDRVPARAAGAARSRAPPERVPEPLDRPALDRLGLERRRQADAGRPEGHQGRRPAEPGRGQSRGPGHPEDLPRAPSSRRCAARASRPLFVAGLAGPPGEEPPPAEEYPADDDIPESEF